MAESGGAFADGEHVGLGKLTRDPVSTEVSSRLLSYLLSGQLKVGDRLPSERQLAEILDVGRNAIRDGLRPLTLLGILEARPGSGTYLRAPTSGLLPQVIEWGLLLGEPSLRDVMETRLYTESALARLAAQRRTASSMEAIRAAANRMESAAKQNRRDRFHDADMALHLSIAEAAQNDVLAGILRSARTLTAAWIRRGLPHTPLVPVYDEHTVIVEAIERQDGDAARAAMESHLENSKARLFEALAIDREAARQHAGAG